MFGARLPAVLRYLSAEWVAGIEARAAGDERLRAATADVAVTIQHVITGGPEGDVAFHVTIDHGSVAARPGRAERPTVTLESDYATAAAVSKGEESAPRALMRGRLRARGDLAQLVACQEALGELEDVFRSVRESTVY